MKRWIARWMILLLLFGVFGAAAEEEKPARLVPDEMLIHFFDNSIFVGDSITRQLRVYCLEQQKQNADFFAKSRFFTAQSYMLYIASRKYLQSDRVNLQYRGSDSTLVDIIRQTQPDYVFILLGVNDYIGETIDKGIGYVERIIDLAAEVSPGTKIVFESLTPVTKSFCRKKDYRTMWDNYNVRLQETCEQKSAYYLDIASCLKDENGYLREEYSSDGKYHLVDKGLKLWTERLLDFAYERYEAGDWTPESI